MARTPHDRLTDWFRDWRAPLRRFLQRHRKDLAADVDDVAQEVCLRLLRYDRSDLVEHPQAYLYKVAMNVSAEWATRSSRRRQHSPDWIDTVSNFWKWHRQPLIWHKLAIPPLQWGPLVFAGKSDGTKCRESKSAVHASV
jgi:DNA-directed RNA polymerase specialized sigma24 family protein